MVLYGVRIVAVERLKDVLGGIQGETVVSVRSRGFGCRGPLRGAGRSFICRCVQEVL